MPTRHYETPEGDLTFWVSWWNGRETVRHRGRIVSEDRSLSLISHHRFQVPGRGAVTAVQYDLWYGLFWGWNLKRNGVTIAEERSGRFLSWALSFGLLMIVLHLASPIAESFIVQRFAAPPSPWPSNTVDYVMPLAMVGAFPLAWWIRKKSRDKLKR